MKKPLTENENALYLDTCDWPLILNPPDPKGDDVIATIPLPKGSDGVDEAGQKAVAYAKLFRASPVMLDALREALSWIPEGERWQEGRDKIEAVIALAEGKDP